MLQGATKQQLCLKNVFQKFAITNILQKTINVLLSDKHVYLSVKTIVRYQRLISCHFTKNSINMNVN